MLPEEITFFVDYGFTIDMARSDGDPPQFNFTLLDALAEFKKAGAKMVLATDGDDYSAKRYIKDLKANGYDLFDDYVSSDTHDLKKLEAGYWDKNRDKFDSNGENFILIDDNHSVLMRAKKENISNIWSLEEELIPMTKQLYTEKLAA